MNSKKRKKKRTVADYSPLGKIMAVKMITYGYNNKKLAEKLNVTSLSLSSILFGDHCPSTTTIYNISKCLDIDIETIITTMKKRKEMNTND